MFGAVDEWFTRSLGGIQQAINSVDYRILDIKPAIIGNISYVKATYKTTRGWIQTEWNRFGTTFTLKVKVPHGSIANVYVPGTNAKSDYGTFIYTERTKAMTMFKTQSGIYTFESIFI
jgi:hypothetical protein